MVCKACLSYYSTIQYYTSFSFPQVFHLFPFHECTSLIFNLRVVILFAHRQQNLFLQPEDKSVCVCVCGHKKLRLYSVLPITMKHIWRIPLNILAIIIIYCTNLHRSLLKWDHPGYIGESGGVTATYVCNLCTSCRYVGMYIYLETEGVVMSLIPVKIYERRKIEMPRAMCI